MSNMSIKTFLAVSAQLPVETSVLLRGPHGIGKSQVVRQVAQFLKKQPDVESVYSRTSVGNGRVVATLKPSADSDIQMELWLPLAGWNGNFRGTSPNGLGGVLNYNAMAVGLTDGFAVASTDSVADFAGAGRIVQSALDHFGREIAERHDRIETVAEFRRELPVDRLVVVAFPLVAGEAERLPRQIGGAGVRRQCRGPGFEADRYCDFRCSAFASAVSARGGGVCASGERVRRGGGEDEAELD